MGRHKEISGLAYEIVYQDNHEANLRCVYKCPYCNRETTDNFIVYSNQFHLLDGVTVVALECEHCNETAKVRYMRRQRI